MLNIAIVGAGYVGLVAAPCFAHFGNTVTCLDIDAARVARLRDGILPIMEPGLDDLVARGLAEGRLRFETDPASLHGADLVIVAVGTLDSAEEWTDRTVRAAVRGIVSDPRAPRRIVIRSTLLPGTAVTIADEVAGIDPEVRLALNPEFTREGSAVDDFLLPDRVVIGVPDPSAGDPIVALLRELYAPLESPIVVTDLTSAETIKMASNVFLATKIAFANELARLCAATGADVQAVVEGMGLDKRIGRAFLSPGPGFGGSCLPSQARVLPALAAARGLDVPLMAAIDRSNTEQGEWLVQRAERAVGGSVSGLRVALLGLAFKAGTDDLRDSPALRLAALFEARGALVTAYDPVATDAAVRELGRAGTTVSAASSAADAVHGANVIAVATEWPEFASLDWSALAASAPGRVVLDARNIVDRQAAEAAGFEVIALGGRAATRAGAAASPGQETAVAESAEREATAAR
jgi:UDPglucose 6-dehydrogenase